MHYLRLAYGMMYKLKNYENGAKFIIFIRRRVLSLAYDGRCVAIHRTMPTLHIISKRVIKSRLRESAKDDRAWFDSERTSDDVTVHR